MDAGDDWLDPSAPDAGERRSVALEREFRTLGFREGMAAEYEQTLQAGFDAGFGEGYAAGWEEARVLGAASALIDVLAPAVGRAGEPERNGSRAPPPVRLRVCSDAAAAEAAVRTLRALCVRIEARLAHERSEPAADSPRRGDSAAAAAERAELAEVLRAVGVGEAAWPECVRERTTSGE